MQVCDHVLAKVFPIAPQPFGPIETKAEEQAAALGASSPYVADISWARKVC